MADSIIAFAELMKWARPWRDRWWLRLSFCRKAATSYINDSKKLSAAKREELYDVIMDKAVAVGNRNGIPRTD